MKNEVFHLYPDREDVTLTTYILQDSPEMLAGKSRPAILICPGGAYLNCSDREAEPVAVKFAAMGYHAFVLRYSVYKQSKHEKIPDVSKKLEKKTHCQHPAPMRDIGKAMLMIHEHAKEWLVDVEKIALCGFSAGAHNVAMYATNWHKDVMCRYFDEEKEKFRPSAVILGYTLSDYVFMCDYMKDKTDMNAIFFRASLDSLLGTRTPSCELQEELSPAHHVTKNTPPFFIWATAADELVPVQNSVLMAQALAEKNIPFELHIFEEGPHGLSLATQATAGARSHIYPKVAKWSELAGEWLEKRFALDLPETVKFIRKENTEG